jgi:hypothetical protein
MISRVAKRIGILAGRRWRYSRTSVIDAGVDLVFTNQLHPAWSAACHDRGFLNAPSNFAFYRAPQAQAMIAKGGADRVHMNRGDCDGPVWYAARGVVGS